VLVLPVAVEKLGEGDVVVADSRATVATEDLLYGLFAAGVVEIGRDGSASQRRDAVASWGGSVGQSFGLRLGISAYYFFFGLVKLTLDGASLFDVVDDVVLLGERVSLPEGWFAHQKAEPNIVLARRMQSL
jgi:hypothetical protein